MARKSIKGYAEKNYYDNTRFNGGIVATNDPLNEGYFKHLVNFDISDMGQSLTPRKGFLTTAIFHDLLTYSFDLSFDISFDDGDEAFFDVSINNTNLPISTFDYLIKYKNGYVLPVDIPATLTIIDPIDVHNNQTYKIYYDMCIPEINDTIILKSNYKSAIDIPNVFKELSFYHNTCIVPVQNYVNSGYTLEFNIDTTPIKYYATKNQNDNLETSLVHIPLNNSSIYFYDASIGRYIFLDLKSSLDTYAWIINFDNTTKFINDCRYITNIDYSDLASVIPLQYINYIVPEESNQAMCITDINNVTSYIIKVRCTKKIDDEIIYDGSFWLQLYYRENKSEYMGKVFEADTLVLSYLDTEDIVNHVDTTQRNIASFRSVIPDPMQTIYSNEYRPDGHTNTIPMIYVKDSNNKYLFTTTQHIEGLEIIPNFYLEEPPANYVWAYTYDVLSSNKDVNLANTSNVHKGDVYSLSTNELLIGSYVNMYLDYFKHLNTTGEDYVSLDGLNIPEYKHYIQSLNFRTYNKDLYTGDAVENTLVIYAVPKHTSENYVDNSTMSTCELIPKLNAYDELLWLLGIHNVKVEGTIPDTMPNLKIYKDVWDKYNIWQNQYTIFRPFVTSLENPIGKLEPVVQFYEMNKLYSELSKNKDTHNFHVKPFKEIIYDFNSDSILTKKLGYDSIIQTALTSDVIAFEDNGMTFDELWKFLCQNDSYNNLLIKPFTTVTKVDVDTSTVTKFSTKYNKSDIYKLFPGSNIKNSDGTYGGIYYLYTTYKYIVDGKYEYTILNYSDYISEGNNDDYNNFLNYFFSTCSLYSSFFKTRREVIIDNEISTTYVTSMPLLTNSHLGNTGGYPYCIHNINTNRTSREEESLFKKYNEDTLSAILDTNNKTYKLLNDLNYFSNGFTINMYLMLIPDKSYIDNNPYLSGLVNYTREYFKNTTSLKQSRMVYKSADDPVTYVETLTEEPLEITNAVRSLVFSSSLGDHLVIYNNNKVYISKEGYPNYFTEANSFIYEEQVVKVIQYKDMLLVFTKLNLYAIYLYEQVMNVQNGIDDKGNIQYVQQTHFIFASLPVLYNLMVDDRYKDAIQVYNQMVLFYSADGQMFLIKPTAAIDSNTRFSIQYFNKSANDILLNYKDYMQERLYIYGIDSIINDVEIKVTANINYIKIFYTAPGIMTYILIYDVLNNRYYSYDTLSFSKIHSIHNITLGELYVTEYDNKLYFTIPYYNTNDINNNVDATFYDHFNPEPIKTEIDTGIINLNNHLKKRFKDLHVIYKNLNANQVEFSLSTFIDDVPIITYVESSLEIRSISSFDTLVVQDTSNVQQLIEQTALFNFSEYSSNKIITHKTNIISKGKSIRIKMNFTSKGKYKIQGYGLIYKEHTV